MLIFASNFMVKSINFYISKQITDGRSVTRCGTFLGMRDGENVMKGRVTKKSYGVFLVDGKELTFKKFFYKSKDKVLMLNKNDSICLVYVVPPFPCTELIVIDVNPLDAN